MVDDIIHVCLQKAVVERSVCSCVDSMVDWYDKADVCVAMTTIVAVR